jgi:hypothetical protein
VDINRDPVHTSFGRQWPPSPFGFSIVGSGAVTLTYRRLNGLLSISGLRGLIGNAKRSSSLSFSQALPRFVSPLAEDLSAAIQFACARLLFSANVSMLGGTVFESTNAVIRMGLVLA